MSDTQDAPRQRLFDALRDVGLDRKRLSIHEMLIDILEVVEVAEGVKPSHLAGQGERALWQIDAFERIAAAAGLLTLRTPPIPPVTGRYDTMASSLPLMAATLRRRTQYAAEPRLENQVLWIYRDDALAEAIAGLTRGELERLPGVLGYPACCVAADMQAELRFVREVMQLYQDRHGLHSETAVAQAIGRSVQEESGIGGDMEPVWRTRLAFPYVGHTACRECLGQPDASPSGLLNRRARELAFALDPAFARGVWRAALSEAALATTGHFQSLDPAAQASCPCGSGLAYRECCEGEPQAQPAFR